MWADLLVLHLSVAEKVVRTVLVYALIVVLFRMSGKRGLAQLNTFDFVVVFLLSNVVQNAVIGDDDSVTGAAIGAATLVAVNAVLNRWLARGGRVARWVIGRPTPVIEDGRLDQRALRRLGLRPGEVEHAVRMQNGDAVQEVALGRLDPGGQLIITLKPEEQNATRGDVDALAARLSAIERLLRRRPPPPD